MVVGVHNIAMARNFFRNADCVGIAMAVLGILSGFSIPVVWWQADTSTVLLVALAAFVFGGCTFMFAKGALQILLFFFVFSSVLLWIRGFQNLEDGTGGIGLTWFMCVISGTIMGANYRPDNKKQGKRQASGALR
jgi:hypothetical protein